MTRLQIELPDALADAVKRAGLLDAAKLARVFRLGLLAERREYEDLKAAIADDTYMTMDEIDAEVKAYRAERQRAGGSPD